MVFTGTIPADINADALAYALNYCNEEGNTVVLDNNDVLTGDRINDISVIAMADGGVTTYGSGLYTSGDVVTVLATSKWDTEFLGWYQNDKLISSEPTYSFVATEDVLLVAKFETKTFHATFTVDDHIVEVVEFVGGVESIAEPAVPQKEGYTCKWETYSLNGGDVTIKAVYTPNTYLITWNVDGKSTTTDIEYGRTIIKPSDPVKDGYTFIGWTPEVPTTMPAKDLNFTAMFEMTSNLIIKIHNYTANKTIDYRTTITFSADPIENPVSGAQIHWFIDGQDKGASDTYTVKEAKKDFTVQAKYIKDGKSLAESEIETVKVNAGFFAWLKAFFRALFGRLPKVVQEYLGVEIIDRVLP